MKPSHLGSRDAHLSSLSLRHVNAWLKPHRSPSTLSGEMTMPDRANGTQSPDAHRPGLFMFEPALEEKCENIFLEHGGRVRSLGAREAEDNGAGGVDSDGRIGLGTAARSQRGADSPFPLLQRTWLLAPPETLCVTLRHFSDCVSQAWALRRHCKPGLMMKASHTCHSV